LARNEQLIRQHKVLQILERFRFGRTIEELRDDLVEELGLTSLHTRSVRRDLQALQAAGIDVDSEEIQRGRVWKLGPSFRGAHKITATATELMALSLGRDLLFPLAGTPFWLGIESFWCKIREALPDGVWNLYEKYRRVLHVRGMPAKSYKKHLGMLKTLHRAILEHRRVEVDYQTLAADKPKTRTIEPYAVVYYQSSLYIIAAAAEVSDHQQRVRHWKLDRFLRAKALDDWFRPPEDFDAEEHLAHSLGIFSGAKPRKYRVRISKFAAPWVREDPWHENQKIEQRANGDIVLTVQAAHDMDIIPRVLSLGAQAEVLSPKSCREAMAKIAQEMAAAYKAD